MRNRKFVPFVVALAFAAAAATPALAVTVSRVDGQPMNPNGEPFSATSAPYETLLSKGSISANCVATFNGTITPAGIVNITSTTFTGTNSLCSLIKGSASGMNPWTGQADSATQLTINNAQVNVHVQWIWESQDGPRSCARPARASGAAARRRSPPRARGS